MYTVSRVNFETVMVHQLLGTEVMYRVNRRCDVFSIYRNQKHALYVSDLTPSSTNTSLQL